MQQEAENDYEIDSNATDSVIMNDMRYSSVLNMMPQTKKEPDKVKAEKTISNPLLTEEVKEKRRVGRPPSIKK